MAGLDLSALMVPGTSVPEFHLSGEEKVPAFEGALLLQQVLLVLNLPVD